MQYFSAITIAFVVATVGVTLPASAQSRDAPIPHGTGQSVSPSFEGWYPNPDGSFTLSFGYFNRNFEQTLDIPIGTDNHSTEANRPTFSEDDKQASSLFWYQPISAARY